MVHSSGAIGTDAIAPEARDLPPGTAEVGAFRPERDRIRPKNGEREPSVMASASPTTEVQIH
ncbi:hypothetical protein [Lyngbya sp. CCY1209]|uniref:hypothetical protein n=1 Tax=Lyngbya sp. CCY1209 TaxID=2886103 RepID=UPI002D20D901|nr:hypothetical protein [Lyngbya sp. CCY1209]MEB3883783.1 hypothetical protein [Lyngbya sp. CCY1209]